MFKKIVGTAGSRMIIAAIGLMIAVMNAKYLGPEGLGTIGLIILGITIILLVSNFIGGPTLVYLFPRENNFKLIAVSYLWAVIVIVLFGIILQFLHFVPVEYTYHILLLSLIYSFFSVNLYFLIGSQRIKQHNVITTIQQVIQFGGLILYFIVLKRPSVLIFVYILYVSFIFTLLSSSWYVFRKIKKSDLYGLAPIFKRILKLGSFVQVAFAIQMLNYRLSYYIIDSFIGRRGLGLFHFGNQLAEGTWVVGKSVSIVQYSGISNSNDPEYAKRLTIQLMKLTFVASLAILLFFIVLPESVFALIGKSYTGTKLIILSLTVGIMSNAVAMMFSHYFAGLGKPHHNTVGSSIGLIFTLSLGFWLIPTYGILGAGITASFSYFASLLYLFIAFWKAAKPAARDFLITMQDYRMLKDELNKLLNKSQVPEIDLDDNLP